VINRARRGALPGATLRRASDGQLPATEIAEALFYVGLADTEEVVQGLLTEARGHAERLVLEEEQRAILDSLGRPTVELPLLSDGIDLGGLYELAEELVEQLLEREAV
jgi:hypothetical protein